MFPNYIVMRFFEQPRVLLPSGVFVDGKPTYPQTEEDLENNWNEISRQYIMMYPAGAGARIEQYLKIEEKLEQPAKRRESSWLPLWWEDEFSAYLPGVQNGWAGPVTSLYARVDTKFRQFW